MDNARTFPLEDGEISPLSLSDSSASLSPLCERTSANSARIVEWFEAWRRPLCMWLRRRSSVPPADIDDLAQEVFLRLLRYSDDTAVENPQGYLFRIATNVANEWRERARIRHPHDNAWLEDLQIDVSKQPENATKTDDRDRLVHAAVQLLPPRQREILLLHVNEGLTYKQIAQARGLTYRIVLRDLTKAYSSLRLQLRVEDVL
jgi:RNA polymerase sigma factor (sigma-70 family)